ncbi:MAG: CvpA family protein [Roseiflexaceae bacterium]|nr:CvpA family protein [Roseiflexaceae bacterium]
MSLAITLIIALVLLLLLLVGAWRDLRRGMLALIATLFGAALSGFWGERWGNELASRFDTNPSPIIVAMSIMLLAGVALLIGYGGGILLPPLPKVRTWQQRVAGGTLGLLNGIVLVGYLLRIGTRDNPAFAELIGSAAPTQLLYDSLPFLFLATALIGGAIIIGKSAMLALRKRAAAPSSPLASRPVPPATPSSVAPLPTTAEQHENQQRTLDKINNRLR